MNDDSSIPPVQSSKAAEPGGQTEKTAGLRAPFTLLMAAAALLISIGLAGWLAGGYGTTLDPVQFRVYVWDNAIYFLYLPVAFLLFVVLRLLRGNGYLRRGPLLGAGYAIAAGLLFSSLPGFQVVRPEPIVWTDLQESGGQLWLPQLVSKARAMGVRENRPVLYYLHADWCDSCEDFESYILGSPYLQRDLDPFIKVRLDVTDTHRWQDYLDHKLGVSAVPSIIVRDRVGRLIPRPIIGENVSLHAVRSVLEAATASDSPPRRP